MNLVIQTAFLGDLLLAIPLLNWVRNIHPQMSLGLICRKGLGSTLKTLGIIDHFWEIKKGDAETYREVLTDLKNFDINLLLSAHTSFRTTLFCAQIKAQKKVTFSKPWNHFVFDERIKWPEEYPESIRLLSLLKNHSERLKELFSQLPAATEYIIKHGSGKLLSPPEWLNPHHGWKEQGVANTLLATFGLEAKNWIALFPGSVWATKMWTKEGYIELGQELQKKGFKIVVMGGAQEKELGEAIASQIPEAINLCGKTSLIESLALMSKARLVVGNDSSSSHMAALVNVPVVAIYGPTVLRFGYRPWAFNSAVAEFEGLECRPCGPHGHRACPLGHHNCMKKLGSGSVLRVVEGLLQQSGT